MDKNKTFNYSALHSGQGLLRKEILLCASKALLAL